MLFVVMENVWKSSLMALGHPSTDSDVWFPDSRSSTVAGSKEKSMSWPEQLLIFIPGPLWPKYPSQ